MAGPQDDKPDGDAGGYFVEFRAGETIFKEHEKSYDMFIIQSGSVEILKSVQGKERRLSFLGRGEIFGEMSLLERLPRVTSARASEDCRLLRIDESMFDDLLAERPEIANRMLHQLASRLHEVCNALAGPDWDLELREAARAPDTAAGSLLHPATGKTFLVYSNAENVVGRVDELTGHVPLIDLSEVDELKTVSRWHARFLRCENRWFILEVSPSRNGTFVGGEPVRAGQLVPLEDGAEIRFGAVETVFRVS